MDLGFRRRNSRRDLLLGSLSSLLLHTWSRILCEGEAQGTNSGFVTIDRRRYHQDESLGVNNRHGYTTPKTHNPSGWTRGPNPCCGTPTSSDSGWALARRWVTQDAPYFLSRSSVKIYWAVDTFSSPDSISKTSQYQIIPFSVYSVYYSSKVEFTVSSSPPSHVGASPT